MMRKEKNRFTELRDCIEKSIEYASSNQAVRKSAASFLTKSIIETQIKISLDILEKVDALQDFKDFYLERPTMNVFDALKEFGKLYPDKFYVSETLQERLLQIHGDLVFVRLIVTLVRNYPVYVACYRYTSQ